MTPTTGNPAPPRRRVMVVGTAVAVLAVVPSAAAGPEPSRQDLRGPLPGSASVVTPFDPPARRWLSGHRGVDLAATPLAVVRAPADGGVLFAGAVGGRPVLSIDHGAGLRTTYEPVRATVRAGDQVVAGDVVGHVLAGHPGCPVSACLHWGARIAAGGVSGDDDEYADPLSLLAVAERPIRLKPTRPGDGAG
ncbi:M23 family metallopeptidase [Rhodococcus sp. IEGM 1408]|uniref:M23 family metallopeptidase n=1 Tax=Rhodococcus sp. IEGM 1408 TaxID=3082220 RepID=UPI002953238A|nr:M23 family metallopeptidase [Rhodococcus sp. IEGM 1408]MDV8000451.1 M23 family metallopeptidase [Rhodococcus sp. IEGM 1408]